MFYKVINSFHWQSSYFQGVDNFVVKM